MNEDRKIIELRPDVDSYLSATAVMIVCTVYAWYLWDPLCALQYSHCNIFDYRTAKAAITLLSGGIVSYLFVRRQFLTLDTDGLRRWTSGRQKLVRWADITLVTLTKTRVGQFSTMQVIVIDQKPWGQMVIYESSKTKGAEMLRIIESYMTAHSIAVRTRNALAK